MTHHIKVVVGGVCSICGHKQETHEGNKGCTEQNCDCIGISEY